MLSTELLLVLLHILSAIVALGFTTSFGVIMAGAAGDPAAAPVLLRTVARLERIASPCFGALVGTGVVLIYLNPHLIETLWIRVSLGLTVVAAVVANAVARPTIKRQLALIEQTSPPVSELQQLGLRSKKIGMLLSLNALVILGLMVFKPTL